MDALLLSVADLFALGWGEGGESWKGRRRLFAWEKKMVGECCSLLSNVFRVMKLRVTVTIRA